MTAPLTVVIFGASGDLTARKLIPALYRLDVLGLLPDETKIVGVSRREYTDEVFRETIQPMVKQSSGISWLQGPWTQFAKRISYVSADAEKPEGIQKLNAWLQNRENNQGGRRLYYLSVGPELYPGIVTRLGEAGMNKEDGGYRRLIIEKPFGRDRRSARDLNNILHQHFTEDQIYRIDHYLGKDTVQNIMVFRFANTLFEPLWNHKYIDHVQITVSEKVVIGKRGAMVDFFEAIAVLERDLREFQSSTFF